MWRAVLVLVLAAAAGTGTAGAAGKSRQAVSHCAGQERVVYSCSFGRKMASLCLGKRSVHYRFGLAGRPEIDLASTPGWSNVRTHQLYSNAFAQEHVRISKGAISYLVHFGEAGRFSDVPGMRISGIVVLDGAGKALADLHCKGRALIDPRTFGEIALSAPPGWEGGEEPNGPFDGYF
jgi:hypothetical protein